MTPLALLCWVSVGKLGVPETFGSFAAAVLSSVPAFFMAVIRAGRAYPLSLMFWPSVL